MPLPRIHHTALLLLTGLLLIGCHTPYEESDAAREKAKHDPNGDAKFESVVNTLRKAASKKDRRMLASMMTRDFGYRWDETRTSETPFDYWDRNQLWPALVTTLNENFVTNGGYIVAVSPYGAVGIREEMGSWKFAYFVVGAPPTDQQQPRGRMEMLAPPELPPIPQ